MFFSHTGDIGVTLAAASLDLLFREAALAFTETLVDLPGIRPASTHTVSLSSPDLDSLMVEWLSELVYRFEVQNLLVADAAVHVLQTSDQWRLDGAIQGERLEPARHAIKVLIKGVTYHRLSVHRHGDEWRTDVVFDI
jgi:SHS2 domain-containing protein